MHLITVLPLSKKARTDILSYFHKDALLPGTLVEVPFRSGQLKAMVTESRPINENKSEIKGASFQLRKVNRVLQEKIFSPKLLDVCRALAQFYLLPVSKVIDEIVPESYFEQHKAPAENPQTPHGAEPASLLNGLPEERMSWYKTRIRELFAQKRSIYIVFPTDHEARAWHAKLSRGIEEYAVYISGTLPKKKLGNAIAQLEDMSHAILVCGTASFLSFAREDLGTIIIEHESAPTYRRMTTPAIDMRLFVEELARSMDIPLVFADTLPRVETYARYQAKELADTLPFTFHPDLPERETVITRKSGTERGNFRIISSDLIDDIERAMYNGSRVFLFALRNGIASVTVCRDCGETLRCEFCQAPLALYKSGDKRIFICKSCKRHTPSDEKCRRCGSWNLNPYGIGVETVYEECVSHFGESAVMRLDRASVKSEKEASERAAEFEQSKGKILVGTELALNYLTEKVPTTGIVSFDSLFSIPSYRVSERIVDLITSIRMKTERYLVIQTMYPDDRLLAITSKPKLFAWYDEEIAERKEFQYPPETTLIKLVGTIPREALTEARTELEARLAPWQSDTYTTASPERKESVRLHALIRIPKESWWFAKKSSAVSRDVALVSVLEGLKETFAVSVNPEDLL